MYSKPTIILSTGRAGSSAVAGMMYHLGIFMGENLVPADKNNPAGHYEDKNIKKINLALLKGEISKDEFLDKAETAMNYRATEYKDWGWKVPSTANVIEGWLKNLKDYRIIWCKRPREEVIDSMNRAYGWSEEKAGNLHDKRRHSIEKALEKTDKYMVMEFEDVIDDPEATVERIISFTGVRPLQEERERAIAYITQEKPDEDTKVLIALHNGGWVRKEICYNAITWSIDRRYKTTFSLPQAKPYTKNVNKTIQEEFLPNDFDFLLIVDADNPPQKNPLDLIQLNKPVIACPTPQWSGDIIYPVVMDKVAKKQYKSIPPKKHQGLQEVDAVGSGCVLIRRDVIEAVDNDNKGPVWKDKWKEKGTERTTGDYNFCDRARDNDFKIWANFDYPCEHIKELGLQQMLNYANKRAGSNNMYWD